MRPDVKYGIVFSAAIVLVGGLYFVFRDKGEAPVPVASGQQPPADAVATRTPSTPDARPAARPARKDTAGADSSASAPRRDGAPVKRTPPARGVTPGTSPSAPGTSAATPATPTPAPRPHTATTPPERTADAVRSDGTAASPDAAKPSDTGREGAPPVAAPSRVVEPNPAQPAEARTATSGPPTEPERVAAREEPERPVPLAAVKPPVRSDVPPAASGRPAVAVDTHRVQPGDTLSSLAQAYYGSTKYAQFLRENNPDISVPDRLAVGTIVRIPPRAEERTPDAAKPSVAEKPAVEKPATDKPTTEKATGAKPSGGESAGGRRTYTVKAGDSFYSIAKDVLGDASRWKELYELNKASVNGDPTHLRIGQIVVLPNR